VTKAPLQHDISDRIAVVTGANTGIGREIARELARLGGRVVLACRSEKRGRSALDSILAQTGNGSLELQVVDLSSQASVRAFAGRLRARHARIDVLVNNASIWPDTREVSVDGIEKTWATNVLGYFLLMTLLRDRLLAADQGRIINVASDFAGGLDLDDPEFARRAWGGTAAYRQSKQAERMLTWSVAERLEGTRVTVNACHPGGVDTALFRYQTGLLGLGLSGYNKLFGKTPAEGADTPAWLATAPELSTVTGRYYEDRKEKPRKYDDAAERARLWELCEAQVADSA
jgi:NAD(P)-dependent dehydrogenase (short-subunit alcohol dehydrogenase family)